MADKRKITLHDLFMNNKFVLIFSIFTALIIWIMASLTVGTDDTRVIEHVKVTVDGKEESGYQIFGYEDTYVDVTVEGKKYQIASNALSADDISVVAKSNYVDYSGYQTLTLNAEVKNNSNVRITDISERSIVVFYDIPKEAQFSVTVKFDSEDQIVPDGYISEEPIASLSTVNVSGPATQINRIKAVEAEVSLDFSITETTALEAKLTPVTANGEAANFITFEDDIDNFTVTIPVSKVVDIPLSVRYINVPEYYNDNMPEVTIKPEKVRVAAAESVLKEMESLIIGTVDFDSLKNTNNKLVFHLKDVEEVKILDDVDDVNVSINCYPMASGVFDVSANNVTLLNLNSGVSAELRSDKISDVTVIGDKDEIAGLNPETQLFAKVDLSSAKVGTGKYKAVVYVKNSNKCWIYGEYSVTVKIIEKTIDEG